MSHYLSNTPVSPGSVSHTVPDAGDGRTAASVTTPLQSIWSAVFWIWKAITGAIPFDLSIDGEVSAANVAASTVVTDGNCTVGGALGVVGSAIASGSVTAGTSVAAGQDINAGRDIIAARNISAAGVVEGRLLYKPTVIATATAGMTASLASGYNVFIYTAVDSGASVLIQNAGSYDGDTIQFISPDPAETHTITVKNPSGTNIASFQGGGGRTFIRVAGNWVRMNWGS